MVVLGYVRWQHNIFCSFAHRANYERTVLVIWAGLYWLLIFAFIPETYAPVLLRRKAIQLRKETGDDRWKAPIEVMDRTVGKTVLWSCIRPFQLLFFEQMCLNLVCLDHGHLPQTNISRLKSRPTVPAIRHSSGNSLSLLWSTFEYSQHLVNFAKPRPTQAFAVVYLL